MKNQFNEAQSGKKDVSREKARENAYDNFNHIAAAQMMAFFMWYRAILPPHTKKELSERLPNQIQESIASVLVGNDYSNPEMGDSLDSFAANMSNFSGLMQTVLDEDEEMYDKISGRNFDLANMAGAFADICNTKLNELPIQKGEENLAPHKILSSKASALSPEKHFIFASEVFIQMCHLTGQKDLINAHWQRSEPTPLRLQSWSDQYLYQNFKSLRTRARQL